MRAFRWLSKKPICARCDLRQRGWIMVDPHGCGDHVSPCPALARADDLDLGGWQEFADWRMRPLRALVLLIGVDSIDARARLLRLGFGDALTSQTNVREIEARALRIVERASTMPRSRQHGRLRLDLFARDGFVGQRPLALHPREFALLWRLADTPGVAVGKRVLVRDVWRMAHVPDTNSLAVHVSRLRAKLALAGLGAMIKTAPNGGYYLDRASSGGPSADFVLADGDGQEAAALAISADRGQPWEVK